MAINTLSKNSISIIVALLLVIILSESKLFFFFTESYLGRSILILILLFASYLNKILGIVCVFIIIIMFNTNISFFNYEGFDNNTNGNDNTSSNVNTSSLDKIKDDMKNKIAEKNNDLANQMQTSSNSPTTSTPSSVSSDNGMMPVPSKINVIASSSNNSTSGAASGNTNTNSSVEGFDLQATENSIKRGKQSNSIPVNPYLKQSVDVAPYEGQIHANSFNEGFSLF